MDSDTSEGAALRKLFPQLDATPCGSRELYSAGESAAGPPTHSSFEVRARPRA
jgi:hypothetical protein